MSDSLGVSRTPDTVGSAIDLAARWLSESGIEEANLNAEILVGHILRCQRVEVRLRRQEPIQPEQWERVRDLIEQRANRRPLQYIIGYQEFMSLRFRVDDRVLIPRSDTETMVEAMLSRLEFADQPPTIVDIGCGCGAIGISLAHFIPEATVYATDISADAVEVARENAEALQVSDRVHFAVGDLLAPLYDWDLDLAVDVMVANLPYVPTDVIRGLQPEVRDHEPRVALDGGPDGLDPLRRLADEAGLFVRPTGMIACEIGLGQERRAQTILLATRWVDRVEILPDISGIPRVVIGYAPECNYAVFGG